MKIQKTTQTERLKNTQAMDQLLYSFFDTNILGFKRILCEEGKFLGKPKMSFLAHLNTKFNELKEKGICGIGIHTGICLDRLPGCEILEVHYALSDELLDENGMFWCELGAPQRKGEIIIRFAFQLNDGKVCDIQSTRIFIPLNKKEMEESQINYN